MSTVAIRDSVHTNYHTFKTIFGNHLRDNGLNLAERVGFEPTIPVKVCPLSRRIVSTTHAPLRAVVMRVPQKLLHPSGYSTDFIISEQFLSSWPASLSLPHSPLRSKKAP